MIGNFVKKYLHKSPVAIRPFFNVVVTWKAEQSSDWSLRQLGHKRLIVRFNITYLYAELNPVMRSDCIVWINSDLGAKLC